MYIIEALKKEFPEQADDLETYDKFLRRHYDSDVLYRIYDSGKENFKYLRDAYRARQNGEIAKYMKNQCAYGRSMNEDPDFLRYYLTELGKDVPAGASVSDMKNMIEEIYGNVNHV